LILALFDARDGRKLSEDVHLDVNCEEARSMVAREEALSEKNEAHPPEWSNIPSGYLSSLRQAIVSVSRPHPEVFLVLRVEKVLQGGIAATCEPYVKPGKDSKVALKVHKAARQSCQKQVLLLIFCPDFIYLNF
jgi:dedicator of cytokinesis protein 9/10/11